MLSPLRFPALPPLAFRQRVTTPDRNAGHTTTTTTRILALDGLRGVLALMVVVSHYFGEVPNGFAGVMFAWIAVKMFFVLSGLLMANIILDHLHSPNFAKAFYMRRACRTLPVYFVLLAVVFTSAALFKNHDWMEADRVLPLWSFLTFTQGFVMVARGDFGLDWLTPSWTLTVEEQFYLIAPVICLLAPRRFLLAVLILLCGASIVFRGVALETELMPKAMALVTLPAAMHSMFFGMIAALLLRSKHIDWSRFDLALRIAPLACLVLVFFLKFADGGSDRLFQLFGVPLTSLAGAFFLMAILRNAPEAERLKSDRLRFFGRLSYGIYLLHMPVLGLMHGLILNARPDIATGVQIAVTIAAVPVAIFVSWLVNIAIEQPMINYGRTWKFAKPRATS